MTVPSHSASRSPARPEPARDYAVAALAGSGLLVAALVVAAALLGRSVSPITWYVARASGIVLYLLVWLSVMTGLGLTTALLDRYGGRGVVFSLHTFSTELTNGFLSLHLLSLAADPTVRLSPRELLLPFATRWHEPWTGCGVLAAYLMVLIGVSFAVKRIIGHPAWRALHWLTFPLYALAFLHGLGAGSDAPLSWAQVLYLTTASPVVFFSLYRLLCRGPRKRPAVTVAQPTAPQPASLFALSQPVVNTRTAHARPGH
jgi:sulfoxide reductase heme-binding subunit YedZ